MSAATSPPALAPAAAAAALAIAAAAHDAPEVKIGGPPPPELNSKGAGTSPPSPRSMSTFPLPPPVSSSPAAHPLPAYNNPSFGGKKSKSNKKALQSAASGYMARYFNGELGGGTADESQDQEESFGTETGR